MPALVGEARVARDHEQPAQPREAGDDVFGDPVGEVLLLGVAAHVGNGSTAMDGLAGSGRAAAADGRCPRLHRRREPIDAHRPRDVLELALAQILEAELELASHLVVDTRCDTQMPPGSASAFEPCRDVDAVAVDVVALDDDVADVDADAELDPLVLRYRRCRSAMPRWISTAQRTASTALANSTSNPSPVVLTMRP